MEAIKMVKKLYVWTDFNPDWTSGLAFAIADSEEQAREIILKKRSGREPYDWGDLQIHSLKSNIGFCVSGGG